MTSDIKAKYLALETAEDPKQKELGIRILDCYDKADVLDLEMKWPDPPLKEKIIALVEKNLFFQFESLISLIDAYRPVDPLDLPFLSPPYNKRNVQSFIKKCAKLAQEEPAPLSTELNRKKRWSSFFLRNPSPGSLGMELIPRGSFVMGNKNGDRDARKEHRVQITRDFWMCRTQITQTTYKRFVSLFKEQDPTLHLSPSPSGFMGPQRPVDSVSWFDALVFSNLLSQHDGFDPVYDLSRVKNLKSPTQLVKIRMNIKANGYRLPTEAEWEYAARSNRNYLFSGSNNIDDVACYVQNSVVYNRNCTISVASKRPNAWGLYDMSGNVDEWCWDGYEQGFYRKSPKKDPTGARTATDRVIRGGAYDAEGSPVWERNKAAYLRGREDIGFRLVRTCT